MNEAHAHGIGVLLDVVYNHAGPDGNYLPTFSERYFSKERQTEWGAAINFRWREQNGPVREFFACNAAYWIKEFHLDGLRLDATHSISDSSKIHILAGNHGEGATGGGTAQHYCGGGERDAGHKAGENESCGRLRDWMRSGMRIFITRRWWQRREAGKRISGIISDPSQELLSCMKHGFLYQGQWYSWQKKRRGGEHVGN